MMRRDQATSCAPEVSPLGPLGGDHHSASAAARSSRRFRLRLIFLLSYLRDLSVPSHLLENAAVGVS